MKATLTSLLDTIRKHSVLTEIVLVGFAVSAFVLSYMLGLPSDAAQGARAAQVQVSVESPAGTDPAGS